MLNVAHVACNGAGDNQGREKGDNQLDLCSLMKVEGAVDEGLGLACLADYNMNMPKWGGWWGKWNGDESKRRTVPAPKSHCLSQQQTVLTACTFSDRRAIVSRHSLIYFLISLPLFFRFTLFIPSGWDPAIAPEFGPDVHSAVSVCRRQNTKRQKKAANDSSVSFVLVNLSTKSKPHGDGQKRHDTDSDDRGFQLDPDPCISICSTWCDR